MTVRDTGALRPGPLAVTVTSSHSTAPLAVELGAAATRVTRVYPGHPSIDVSVPAYRAGPSIESARIRSICWSTRSTALARATPRAALATGPAARPWIPTSTTATSTSTAPSSIALNRRPTPACFIVPFTGVITGLPGPSRPGRDISPPLNARTRPIQGHGLCLAVKSNTDNQLAPWRIGLERTETRSLHYSFPGGYASRQPVVSTTLSLGGYASSNTQVQSQLRFPLGGCLLRNTQSPLLFPGGIPPQSGTGVARPAAHPRLFLRLV